MTLQYIGLSDIGHNRVSNQDVWAALPEFGFFALADGMGGRKGGEIAAQAAVHSISLSMQKLARESDSFKKRANLIEEMKKGIEEANQAIYRIGREKKHLFGMGTTLSCLLWIENTICYGHIGDSRIYRMREGVLEQLTQDHSLFEQWLAKKNRSPKAPPKHILTQALGTSIKIEPEVSICTAEENDLFLLCSDGLSNAVQRRELQEILCGAPSLKMAAQEMIFKAKKRESGDNITVLIIQPVIKTIFSYENLSRQ